MAYSPAYCRPYAYQAFQRELREVDSPLGLLRAASAISLHAIPEGRIEADSLAVQKLAQSVQARVGSEDQQALLAHLHDVLFEVVGFAGNAKDFYNPANSFVGQVLKNRIGLPISLALIYRTVASLIGLRAEGINAPGHFLAAVTVCEGGLDRTLFIDPYHHGKVLNQQEAVNLISSATGRQEKANAMTLAVASPSDWLLRMLRNLQGVYAQRGQLRDLLAMQELQATLK